MEAVHIDKYPVRPASLPKRGYFEGKIANIFGIFYRFFLQFTL